MALFSNIGGKRKKKAHRSAPPPLIQPTSHAPPLLSPASPQYHEPRYEMVSPTVSHADSFSGHDEAALQRPSDMEVERLFQEAAMRLDLKLTMDPMLRDLSIDKKWWILCHENTLKQFHSPNEPSASLQHMSPIPQNLSLRRMSSRSSLSLQMGKLSYRNGSGPKKNVHDDTPGHYVQLLQRKKLVSVKWVRDLAVRLRTMPIDWVHQFIDLRGIQALVECLEKSFQGYPEEMAPLELELVKCLKALANNMHGIKAVLSDGICIDVLTRSVLSPWPATRRMVCETLTLFCYCQPPIGHTMVLQALDALNEDPSDVPFEAWLQSFHHSIREKIDPLSNSTDTQWQEYVLSNVFLVSALVEPENVDDQDRRLLLRQQMYQSNLESIFNDLALINNESIQNKIREFRSLDDQDVYSVYGDSVVSNVHEPLGMIEALTPNLAGTKAYQSLQNILYQFLQMDNDTLQRNQHFKLIEHLVTSLVQDRKGLPTSFKEEYGVSVGQLLSKLGDHEEVEQVLKELYEEREQCEQALQREAELVLLVDRKADGLVGELRANTQALEHQLHISNQAHAVLQQRLQDMESEYQHTLETMHSQMNNLYATVQLLTDRLATHNNIPVSPSAQRHGSWGKKRDGVKMWNVQDQSEALEPSKHHQELKQTIRSKLRPLLTRSSSRQHSSDSTKGASDLCLSPSPVEPCASMSTPLTPTRLAQSPTSSSASSIASTSAASFSHPQPHHPRRSQSSSKPASNASLQKQSSPRTSTNASVSSSAADSIREPSPFASLETISTQANKAPSISSVSTTKSSIAPPSLVPSASEMIPPPPPVPESLQQNDTAPPPPPPPPPLPPSVQSPADIPPPPPPPPMPASLPSSKDAPPPPPPPPTGLPGSPPPPPPPPAGLPGSPPPPPPFGSPLTSGTGTPNRKESSYQPKQKLKYFEWEKIHRVNISNTVWNQLDSRQPASLMAAAQEVTRSAAASVPPLASSFDQSLEFQLAKAGVFDEMERAFAQKAPVALASASGAAGKIRQIKIIDAKKAHLLSITLSHMKHLTLDQIHQYFLNMDPFLNNEAILNALVPMTPSQDEQRQLAEYLGKSDDEKAQLAKPDQFCLMTMMIPRFKERLQCMLYRSTFEENSQDLAERLRLLRQASDTLYQSEPFKDLLQLILLLGNYLNGNSLRGGAFGVRIRSINKLIDTKGTLSTPTLLHFLVSTVEAKFPATLDFIQDLETCSAAHRVSMAEVGHDFQELIAGQGYLDKELQVISLAPEDTFASVMLSFQAKVQEQMNDLKQLRTRASASYEQVVKHFGETGATMGPDEFFGIFRTFLVHWQKCSLELQQAKLKRERVEVQRKQEMEKLHQRNGTSFKGFKARRKNLLDASEGDDQQEVMDRLMEKLRTGTVRRSHRASMGQMVVHDPLSSQAQQLLASIQNEKEEETPDDEDYEDIPRSMSRQSSKSAHLTPSQGSLKSIKAKHSKTRRPRRKPERSFKSARKRL
ncbi:actin-binding FH2 [Hesseltinella vesiculosa]|uniref:Actin-binding FH2 n=1 Tax=Hesseltinella vesiculosa TaxID=101127 RepID=A0A1X2G3E8_9FUNG|nr:actin-binding FH2 [Hesseltinella vesiculosa]